MTRDPNGFYVYVLFRETGVPFYVGKGRNNRWEWHERSARAGGDTHKDRLIRTILAAGKIIPKVKTHEGLTNEAAAEIEKIMIAAIGREKDGGPLINQTRGGDGCVDPDDELRHRMGNGARGRKLSDEARRKMSESRKGFQISPEARAIGAAKRTGQRRSQESKEKMRAAKLGKKLSPEHVAKIAAKNRGQKRGPISEETRAKMRAAKIGRTLSEEHKKKIGDRSRGRKLSKEARAKISAALTGIKRSPETRAKISAANARRKTT